MDSSFLPRHQETVFKSGKCPLTRTESFSQRFARLYTNLRKLRVLVKQKLGKRKLAVTSSGLESQDTSGCRGFLSIKCESLTAVLPRNLGKEGQQSQAAIVLVTRRQSLKHGEFPRKFPREFPRPFGHTGSFRLLARQNQQAKGIFPKMPLGNSPGGKLPGAVTPCSRSRAGLWLEMSSIGNYECPIRR